MRRKPTVLLISTMDTKHQEAEFVMTCLKEADVDVYTIDAGIMGESPIPVSVSREEVAQLGGETLSKVQNMGHEGRALAAMIKGAIRKVEQLYQEGRFDGVFGLGGSMGTTLGTSVMRTLPVGVPKVMVTTMGSRNTRGFVGTKDILMLHSVCDLAGLNRITRKVLHNGAMAMAGMVRYPAEAPLNDKPLVLLSTLGTTETCVKIIRSQLLADGMEPVVFHTVGAGGQAMDEMIEHERPFAVVDLSLHEITDHLFGGDYDAGPDRGKAALSAGIPTVLVPGNADFLVTGPLEDARNRFPGRAYHMHNAAITALSASDEEMAFLGKHLAQLCNDAKGAYGLLVPMGGFSAFDSEGGALWNPQGRQVFVDHLTKNISGSQVKVLDCHINDPEFALAIIENMRELTAG
ncbi:MAG: Tm-1-like ATP-binding domain-containing protein [Deltaproteobacteria bacterium]|nr:Tm-1-like ATP-binding domain-containing protein [Deltaproteobacteria bacterium]